MLSKKIISIQFNTLLWFIIGLIIFSVTSCRDLVQDEFPDFNPVPTVNSFLVAGSPIRVHISMAGKLDTVPLTTVTQALVRYFVNDSAAGELSHTGNGYYTNETSVQAGSVYRFTIDIPGFPEIMATDTIPELVPLTSVEHINNAGIDEEGHTFPAIRITFPVKPDRVQYFQVTMRINTYKDSWRPVNFKEFSDTVLLAEGLPISVFSTSRIRDDSFTLQLDYSTGSYSTINGITRTNLFPLVVDLKSISYQYYQYLRQLYLYETGRYPDFSFGSYHSFPLYSNVTNGKGIVAGYSVFRSEIITPEPTSL
jgi:hypothetical protein